METREQNPHIALGKIRNLIRFRQKKDFVTFFKDYLISYGKRDYRVMKQAYDKYILFMTLNKDMKNRHTPASDTIRSFAEFLENTRRGTGAASTYGRFRKAVLSAVRQGILKENPRSEIKCSKGNDDLIKDILSEEEIRTLTRSHYHQENPEIRKAFIFSLYTGMRVCDVRALKYCNVDYANRLITFEQSKTKSAGIDKHITWHCARHSFATKMLKTGDNITCNNLTIVPVVDGSVTVTVDASSQDYVLYSAFNWDEEENKIKNFTTPTNVRVSTWNDTAPSIE